MTRNRALRAIEALVAQRERAVIEAAEIWFKVDNEEAEDLPVGDAIAQLRDARALLAQATGQATGTEEAK